MIVRFWVFVILFFAALKTEAQSVTNLNFSARWGSVPVMKDSLIKDSSGRDYRFTKIKQYISGITLLKSGVPQWRDSTYYLIDFLDEKSCHLKLKHNLADFDEIIFFSGIDSAMQTKGAQAGALDPVNGMYWTWQSGYIHTKIEAVMEKDNRKKQVELHLGGYRFPNNTIQAVKVKSPNMSQIEVVFNLQPVLHSCEEKKCEKVMSPGKNAVLLSEIWAGSVR